MLELLSSYFKIEIGRKVLDHLHNVASPERLEELAGQNIADSDDVKSVITVLNVLHILSPIVHGCLPEVMNAVLDLELKLRRCISSPFRKPLLRFLNQNADEAISFFLGTITSVPHSHMFAGLIREDGADILRKALMVNVMSINSTILKILQANESENHIILIKRHAVLILHALISKEPDWVRETPALVDMLAYAWSNENIRSHTMNNRLWPISEAPDYETIPSNRCSIMKYEILITSSIQIPQNIALLFIIIDALSDPQIIDGGFAKRFLYEKIVLSADNCLRKAIIQHFLNFREKTSMYKNTNILRYLLLPLLMKTNDIESVLTSDILQGLFQIWNGLSDSNLDKDFELFVVGFMQLVTFIITALPNSIKEYQKTIVSFALGMTRVDDLTLKQSAHVLLAEFLCKFDIPTKLVSQLFVAQLRNYQPETKTLVKQCLDTMLPVLPARMAASNMNSNPSWAQWIKTILYEDGHNIQQLIAIYQMIIRNSDEIYPVHEHFLPQIVSSLSKLSLSFNATLDSRLITLDLFELILKWESHDKNCEMDLGESGASFKKNQFNESVFSILLRIGISLFDILPSSGAGNPYSANMNPAGQNYKQLFPRALELIRRFAKIWNTVPISIQQLRSSIPPPDHEAYLGVAANTAEILNVLINERSDDWIVEHFGEIRQFAENWIILENSDIIRIMFSINSRLCLVIDNHPVADKALYVKAVDLTISKGLSQLTNISGNVSLLMSTYLNRKDPSGLKNYIPDIIKVLQILVTPSASEVDATSNTLIITESIRKIISTLNVNILLLGDFRKTFMKLIGSVVQLVEHASIHEFILDSLREWIFSDLPVPTIKESTGLALQMLVFQKQGNLILFEKFLVLVADIYAEGRFHRTDITVRLQSAFMLGMASSSSSLSKRFADLLNASIPVSPAIRLRYIFGIKFLILRYPKLGRIR